MTTVRILPAVRTALQVPNKERTTQDVVYHDVPTLGEDLLATERDWERELVIFKNVVPG